MHTNRPDSLYTVSPGLPFMQRVLESILYHSLKQLNGYIHKILVYVFLLRINQFILIFP